MRQIVRATAVVTVFATLATVYGGAARANTSILTSSVVKYVLSTNASTYGDISQVALNRTVTNVGAIRLYFAHDNNVCSEIHALLVDAAGKVVPPNDAPICRTFAYGSPALTRPFDPGRTLTVFDSRRGSDASGPLQYQLLSKWGYTKMLPPGTYALTMISTRNFDIAGTTDTTTSDPDNESNTVTFTIEPGGSVSSLSAGGKARQRFA